MISEVTFQAIAPAHLKLKELTLALSAEPNSPLAMLNESANTPLLGLSSINDEEFFQQFPESVMRDTITGMTEPFEMAYQDDGKVIIPATGEHELVLHELRQMGRQRTAELFDYARNVMQPFITTVIDGYAEPTANDLAEKWSIVDISLNAAYLDPVVEALLGQFTNPASLDWEMSPQSKQVRIDGELELPSTGRASFDNLLRGILEDLGISVKEVMLKLFSEEVASPYKADAWLKAPLRLAQWLLIQYFEKSPWENCGLSGIEWETFCLNYRNALTGWIARYVTNLGEMISTDVLLMGIKEDVREIYVVSDVYRKFQSEHGGDAAAIYGAVYLTEGERALPNYMLSTFVERMDDCRNAWQRQVSIQESMLNENWQQDARKHLKRSFDIAIDSFDDAYLPDNMVKSELRAKVCELIDQRLDRYSMEDPTLLIIRIASETLFAHTDAGYVNEEIHKHMSLGMSGDEAATQVLIDYALNWVMAMARLSK